MKMNNMVKRKMIEGGRNSNSGFWCIMAERKGGLSLGEWMGCTQ